MLKKIPPALSGYVVASVSFGAALAFSYALPPPKLPGYVYGFIFVIGVFISAWRGFGPGILACLATEVLFPYLFLPNFTLANVAIGRSTFLIFCSMLISWTAHSRRRAEAALRQANEQLEQRVSQRTKQLSATVTSLQAEVQDRLAAEQAVRGSEKRFRALIENSSDGLLLLDEKGRILFSGPPILGYTPEEVSGRTVFELIHADDQAETLAQFQQAKAAPSQVMRSEFRARHKDGSWRWIEAVRKNLLDDPLVSGIVVNYRDITERKQLDEQLRQTQRLESLGVLAGGVAHDFNNLLVGILGNASLAADSLARTHPARPMLNDLVTAAERAAGLTRQLLAYSGQGRFVVEPIDLSSVVEEITMLVQTSIPRTVQLRLELARDLPAVEADAGQMQQLLMNLVINAAEAIGDRPGTVTVVTGSINVDEPYLRTTLLQADIAPGPYVFIEVQDNGSGMDEQTIQRIFDPFFTTKFTGRGLGLAAALGIVRGHKGAIKIYSAPGRGSTFKVLLPAAVGKTPVREAVPAHQDLQGHGRVLVVDDEEVVRRNARMTLERYGYAVVLAENGQQAIQFLRQSPLAFDLVLLDLTMPVLSGEDTLRELRKLHPKLPVILSSGFNQVEAIRRFQGKGLAGFIQKPYTAATLAERVKGALSGPTEDQ